MEWETCPALALSDLVRLWLRCEPSEDLDEFALQAASALALEERILKNLAGHMSQAVAKLLKG